MFLSQEETLKLGVAIDTFNFYALHHIFTSAEHPRMCSQLDHMREGKDYLFLLEEGSLQ